MQPHSSRKDVRGRCPQCRQASKPSNPSRARAAVTHFKEFVCLQISGIILFFDEYGDKVTKTF